MGQMSKHTSLLGFLPMGLPSPSPQSPRKVCWRVWMH